jgi:phytanoyl-CoA hydroxylase
MVIKNSFDQEWQFSVENKTQAIDYFNENGFVSFPELLEQNDIDRLLKAYDESVSFEAAEANRDFIFLHKAFEECVKDKRFCNILELIFEDGFDLQHTKLNAKNIDSPFNLGFVEWHQDYPFFPLTNFDLVALSIYLDDEDEDSGCLQFIPGSHKYGALSHCDSSNTFVYKCTDDEYFKNKKTTSLVGKKGTVTLHHCLALHMSEAKRTPGPRRRMIFQYKAEDAVQLAGVIWNSYGYPIRPGKSKGFARFPDGSRVEIRGEKGRLIDIDGKFQPDL